MMTFLQGAWILTINRLDGQRVLVVLGDKDMTDFALDFAAMDMENAHARKILLRLTRLACRKSGIDTRGKRVSVEALPVGESCYLLVTVMRHARRYRLKRGGGVCARFESCTDFLNAVEALYRLRLPHTQSAAYLWNGSYYLVFPLLSPPSAARRILSEYAAQKSGALAAAGVKEHGKPICEANAVEVIGRALMGG